MKLFFNASLHGKGEYRENYDKLFAEIEKTGHKIVASPVMKTEVKDVVKESAKEAGDYYKRLIKWIKQADILLFEVSYPSTSIGYEIALAMQHSKPIIAFRVEGATKNVILESIQDERVQLIDYKLNELSSVVKDAIEYAADQQDTRFNFFISPQIGTYLDTVSKERRLPRAVYLRQLIEEDMENNEEYQDR